MHAELTLLLLKVLQQCRMGKVTVLKMLIFSVSESKRDDDDDDDDDDDNNNNNNNMKLTTSKAVWVYSFRNFIVDPLYI